MANVKINVKDVNIKLGVKWNVTKYKKAQKELISILGQIRPDYTDQASPEERKTKN